MNSTTQRAASKAAIACALALIAHGGATAQAGAPEQANRIYQRLNGTPPSSAVLNAMVAAIQGNSGAAGLQAAAAIAMNPSAVPADPKNAWGFYNITLKTFVTPWTNRDGTVFAPLNDYTATVIGMVRDDYDFSRALSDDILYRFNGVPGPSPTDNNHYATAEQSALDMSNGSVLVPATQSGVYGLPPGATAGLITTRGAAAAFFINGTNRAMFRFTMINHLCHDMQTVMDTTRPTDRIRQDVARSPGGDSRLFLNNCAGCHTGMDPMAQAFAYYNFDAKTNPSAPVLVYTPNIVQAKYTINAQNFPFGYVTPNDAWENRWIEGPNKLLGWGNGAHAGNGAKSLGQELASSDAYAQCQVTKVFQAVCYRAPASQADQQTVAAIKTNFTQNGYKLKSVFQQAVAACAGN